MWPWALNIKYTHATAVQTSEHCSFPNYSTQATATAQSIVVVVPSRIIPSSYPRITTPLLRPACAALTSYCACPVPTSDATFEQMGCTCRQITVQSSRFVEGGAKVLFSDILSCQPIRVRDESSAFLWPCVPLTRGHTRAHWLLVAAYNNAWDLFLQSFCVSVCMHLNIPSVCNENLPLSRPISLTT